MKKGIGALVLLAVISVVALNAWVWLQQKAMLFLPMSGMVATPADWGMGYEEVTLQTKDGFKLYGWYIPSTGSSRVLLFFHGNAGNISNRGETLAIFHRLGLNIFIFDYRGYGRSKGDPSEEGLYTDAEAAWDYLRDKKGFAPGQIILDGRSLGGAVAAKLATEVKPAALILESTFSSVKDLAAERYPILSRLIMLRFAFDTLSRINKITCPLLVVHSTDDEIIPFYLGKKIYDAATVPKSLLRLNGDHNLGYLISEPAYEKGLKAFLERYVPGAKPEEAPTTSE